MFKEVPNYEFIMINKKGVVKSSNTGNILTPYKDKDGYLRIKAWCPFEKKLKGCYVHRALALCFIENSDLENKTQVNHINSDRSDNSLENLEWVTPKGNYDHGVAHGHMVVGVLGKFIEIPDEDVHEICRRLVKGDSQIKISRELGINRNTIFSIKTGQCRVNISSQYPLPPVKAKLTDDVVVSIIQDLKDLSKSNKEIEKFYNLGRGSLLNIIKRKTFKHLTESEKDWDKVQRSRWKPVGSK